MAIVIFIIAALIALLLGGYIYTHPQEVILLQQKFYTLINWRMEPISISKEIRNTKFMGLFLILFALVSCFYYWLDH
ncbi:MAG: hypothetical protein KAS66_10975 [Candidatus Omnitrophica bacterium]|nr:hypothetical protein [Candidatus Omnitrophota bacterium]